MDVKAQDEIEVQLDHYDKNDQSKLLRREKRKIRANIFRNNAQGSDSLHTGRFMFWFRRKLIWVLDMTFPDKRRYYRIHFFMKNRLLHPAMKFLMKVLGKDRVKSDNDIPHEWYNNHIRLFRYCLKESFDDIWRIMIALQKSKQREVAGERYREKSKEVLEKAKSKPSRSYKTRQFAADLWITEMCEDTVDREQCNYLCMRIFHEMAMLYGVSVEEARKVPVPGQWPVYVARAQYDPQYFIQGATFPVWQHPEERGGDDSDANDKKEENKTSCKDQKVH